MAIPAFPRGGDPRVLGMHAWFIAACLHPMQ